MIYRKSDKCRSPASSRLVLAVEADGAQAGRLQRRAARKDVLRASSSFHWDQIFKTHDGNYSGPVEPHPGFLSLRKKKTLLASHPNVRQGVGTAPVGTLIHPDADSVISEWLHNLCCSIQEKWSYFLKCVGKLIGTDIVSAIDGSGPLYNPQNTNQPLLSLTD